MAIVSCTNVQDATGLDKEGLLRRLAAQWTAESAFKNCELVESTFQVYMLTSASE